MEQLRTSRSFSVPATIKDNIIEMIRRMPDDATVDDIIAELFVRQQIDVGLRQLNEGETLTQEEVEKELGRWLS
jgi:predicted transcriptional regulator